MLWYVTNVASKSLSMLMVTIATSLTVNFTLTIDEDGINHIEVTDLENKF